MPTPASGGVRVLHVDDEPAFADMVATYLEREAPQLTVETRTSASEGLERLAADDVDCVVSDYDMPGQDGLEFLETVRKTRPDLPFILYTGRGSEAVASDAVSAGVTDYLQKESGREQYSLLANRIMQAVSHHRAELDYREIFEKATDGILIHDPETGEVIDANRRFCEMNGYTREEVIGMSVGDISLGDPPYTDARGLEYIQNAVDGRPQEFEWVNQTRSGDALPVEVHLKHTTIGGQERVLALVRDRSDRKARERELEELDTLLQTVVQQLPIGVLVEDDDRRIRLANDALCDHLGIDASCDDLVGRDCAAAAAELDEQFTESTAFTEGIDACLATREPVRNERLDLRSGRTLERDYVPYELPDGEASMWLYRDVTSICTREQELEALFDNAPVPVVFTEFVDEEPVVRKVNQAFDRVFGHEAADTVGQSLDALVVPKDHESGASDINERVRAGEQFSTEVKRETPAGVRDFVLHSVPLRPDDSGTLAYAIYHDVTERKEYQRELERQNDRLDRFASIASHDLRNPLTVASGHLELASQESESDHLDAAADALDRCQALIDDLLAIARNEDPRGGTAVVDVGEFVEDAWQLVETTAGTLETEGVPTVEADRRRLQQLLENLIWNAVEHGGPDVALRVGRLDDGFYIADDGPGIPAQDRDTVFETGYSTAPDGTGFGLAIVRDVADAHGWDLAVVESDEGGTRFEFTGVDIVETEESE